MARENPLTKALTATRADQLATAARAGDSEALARLYEGYGPMVLGFLQHLVQDKNLAEDLLHDTFLRLFEGHGQWRPDGKLKPWLFTVARRLAIDSLRSRKRHQEMENSFDGSTIMGSISKPDTDGLQDLVAQILATLPPGYATTFHLRMSQEFTYPEIATICGEPEGTLRSRVHHTLGLLRERLEKL